MKERLNREEPDEAAIWEEVANSIPGGLREWGGDRKLRRLIEHASEWEHVHIGSEALTGRKPLPPPPAPFLVLGEVSVTASARHHFQVTPGGGSTVPGRSVPYRSPTRRAARCPNPPRATLMAEREPEAWETNAAGAFATVGEVAVGALGADRFLVAWPGGEREVVRHDQATQLAHDLAADR